MEFSRVGKHTIKCVISEDEIVELGFTLEEIIGNGERTQEFMNQIFDLAEQKFETKFDLGIKTVRADFLSDHRLSLTFSEHPSSNGMVEHLKDIVNGLMSSIPKEMMEKAIKESEEEDNKKDDVVDVMVMFDEFDMVCKYAKLSKFENVPRSSLYKLEKNYYLDINFLQVPEEEITFLSMLTDEYCVDLLDDVSRRAYIFEHGQIIIKNNAIELLRQL